MTKIVSWNVNSIRVRLPHLVQLKKTIDPDVIMLQETKSTDENFPFNDIKEMGFEKVSHIEGGFTAMKNSGFKTS